MYRHVRRSFQLLVGVGLSLLIAATAAAQPGYYRYAQLTLPFDLYALSNDGAMVGETYGGDFNIAAAVYRNGDLDTFSVPDAFETFPADINASGTVVGAAADENYESVVGFIHTRSGQLTTFSYPGAAWTYFTGINDAGAAVGFWYSDTDAGSFVLAADGQVTPIAPPGYEGVFWQDLNNDGTVVGADAQRGYLLSAGHVTEFPVTQNGFGYVVAINNRGGAV